MNKICFIEPPYHTFIENLDAPFSLMYLAAIAEDCRWEAEILDMDSLDDEIPLADVYGVTSTSPQWPVTVKLSERLAAEFSKSLKIVGGNHISAEPDDLLGTKFDLAVLGEGELPLANTLENYDYFKRFISSPRVSLRVGGKIVKDLDSIPFPARHLVDWGRYKRGIYWGKELLAPAVSIISSRGCPFNCIFCGSHVVFGRRTRFRSVENVIAEIREVVDKMGFLGFNFHDDTFCLNRKRVLRLCEEIAKLNIVWRCLSRVDTTDKEILDAMQKAGCKELILGVESGSQKILDTLQKGTTVKQNLKAMKATKKAGIQLKVGIIVGSPRETWETVEETKKLLKECPPDFWNVSCFTPFPGSLVWKVPEKYGLKILTRDLSQYAMVGKDFRGNVVVETEEMSKTDIEQARDELIDLCLTLSPI